MKQEFNIQLRTTRSGETDEETIEFTIKCNTPKTLEDVQSDFAWWCEECEALATTHPDTDDAYALLFEKKDYKVTFFEFDLTFKV